LAAKKIGEGTYPKVQFLLRALMPPAIGADQIYRECRMRNTIRAAAFVAAALSAFLFASPLSYAAEYYFTPENSAFPNPDRGFYAYDPILGNGSYAQIGDNGVRLVYGAITLRDFVHRDIDNAALDKIGARFAELRSSGLKAVLRVNYNEEETGTDAAMDQMIRHMVQLQPLLSDNKDVIAYIESGFFGQWGEWHDWCGGRPNTDFSDDFCSKHPDTKQTWSKIINELLNYMPRDRFILLRYPGKKEALFGSDPVDLSDAYTSLAKARVGHHNDCFLASSDDMGTYQTFGTLNSVSKLKSYLSRDTEYLPIGGETCSAQSGHRFSCHTALAEMEQLHWTYLNRDYYKGAFDIWEDGGCLDEIDKRLGYRLELLSATLPDALVKGSSQTVAFRIRNSGFARAHHYRTAYLRIFSGSDIYTNLELSDIDIRKIGAGETAILTGSFSVPANVPEKLVSVALWLPDEDRRNRSNSRFSIRLAYEQNESDWSSMGSPGHNVISAAVPVISNDDTPGGGRSIPQNLRFDK
jgi:hypothetical protein